ncbi:MAG: hypothetical protein Q8S32_05760 [Burkholderiaceae bacterium]|jgi:hypothetical protein|nr:hypothetical protein [Burkholderiaceae bacterium]
MASADTFAIAAHLHVLLRRKTGRVTDTEWMATNADYARAMAQLARHSGESLPDEELVKWAERLEQALPAIEAPAPPRPLLTVAKDAVRYMGGLR